MLRIKDRLVKKIFKTDLTKFELVTLLELIKKADERGIAQVYYKDIVASVGCNTSTFYNVIDKLEKLDLIEAYRKNGFKKSEIKIGIYNNDFSGKEGNKNYMKINNSFFCEEAYKKLSAGEIRTMLYLMFRTAKGGYTEELEAGRHNKNKSYYNDYLKSIALQLQITCRMSKKYLKGLLKKKFISIGEEKIKKRSKLYDVVTVAHKQLKVFTLKVLEKGKEQEKKITTLHTHFVHCIQNSCRRLSKKVRDETNLNNTATLIGQYKIVAEKKSKDIYKLIESAINALESDTLNSKTVHNILRSLLKKESLIVSYN